MHELWFAPARRPSDRQFTRSVVVEELIESGALPLNQSAAYGDIASISTLEHSGNAL